MNPEKERAYSKQRHRSGYYKKRRLANIDEALAYEREYRLKNREKILAAHKIRCRTPKYRYQQLKDAAKRGGYELDISAEQYFALISRPCHYCWKSLNGGAGHGLDRVDCSRGYVVDNVVPCCKSCNRIKSDQLTEEEMLAAMAAVKQVRLKNAIGESGLVGLY